MIIKTLKWLLFLALIAILGSAAALHLSARSALDQNFEYSAAAAKLPPFTPAAQDGLVRITANGMEFRARVAGFDGDVNKPAVILLHGWPVTSAMYLDLIEPLAQAGFRVFAPDQRGYSPGARPEGASNYTVDKLTADVLALADAAGIDRFHLVGHDWGAVVGWSTVINHSERVISWSALSIPHPAAFSAALQNDPDQQARSRYFLLFATPWLAESLFAQSDFKNLRALYGAISQARVQEYLAMLREPGALTAGFNWYRATMSGDSSSEPLAVDVTTPTVFVWGNADQAVGRYGVEQQAQYMQGPYQEIELNAGHWLFADQPAPTVTAVVQHIVANSEAGAQ